MTPAGIEPATFRFVVQRLNHWATAVNDSTIIRYIIQENGTIFEVLNEHPSQYKYTGWAQSLSLLQTFITRKILYLE